MLTLPAYIDERYRLDSLIGVGGFCPVFLGRQLSVDRPVAVKMISADGQNPTWTKRFEREAVVLAQLKHNNTVKMFDYGVLQDSICYLVMEYVEGKTLREELDAQGALELRRALGLVCGILESLEEAHALGVIHRDLKPNNIMLTHDHMGREQVRVLDFGVAGLVPGTKVVKVDGAEITADGFIGTPRYAAPEQLTGLKLTPAADVYAIGLLLWEMLLGEPAVPESKVEVCLRYHLGKKAWRVPPEAALPADVRQIIEAALRKDPSERTPSCTAMLAQLRAFLDGAPTAERSDEGLWHPSAGGMDPNVAGYAGLSESSESIPELVRHGAAPRASTLRGVSEQANSMSADRSINAARPLAEPSLSIPRREVGALAPPAEPSFADISLNGLPRDTLRGVSHHTPPGVDPVRSMSPSMSPSPRPRAQTPAPTLASPHRQQAAASATPSAETRWRPAPEMIGLAVTIVVLCGALAWRLTRPSEPTLPAPPANISPEVAKMLQAPIERGSETNVGAPTVNMRELVFQTLRAEGWSVGRVTSSNNLGAVQVSSYRIVREEAELTLEIVQGVSESVVGEFLREDANAVRLGATGLRLQPQTPAGKRALPSLQSSLARLDDQHVRRQ